jgi:hypothetical protein
MRLLNTSRSAARAQQVHDARVPSKGLRRARDCADYHEPKNQLTHRLSVGACRLGCIGGGDSGIFHASMCNALLSSSRRDTWCFFLAMSELLKKGVDAIFFLPYCQGKHENRRM